jgi:hypothetical protein
MRSRRAIALLVGMALTAIGQADNGLNEANVPARLVVGEGVAHACPVGRRTVH